MPLSEPSSKQLIRQVAKKTLAKLNSPHKASEFFATDSAMLKHFNDRNADKKAEVYGRVMMCSDLERDRRIKRFHKALGDAYRKGLSFEDAKADLMQISANTDSHALKTVFATNMRSAYNAARYEAQMMSSKPYLRYVSVGDSRVRDEHAVFHGLILPKDDPFWDSHYPPNGFNCRCKVQAVSQSEIERNKYKVAKNAPATPPPPVGFRNAPINAGGAMVQVFAQRVRELDKSKSPFLAPAREQSIKSKLAQKLEAAQKNTLEYKTAFAKLEQPFEQIKAEFLSMLEGQKLSKSKDALKAIALRYTSAKSYLERTNSLIKVGVLEGKSVFLEPATMGQHLFHEEMSVAEWAFLPLAIKNGVWRSKGELKITKFFYAQKRYRVALKYNRAGGKYFVETFFVDDEKLR